LKPENVLIHRTGHIVLTDFGLSKILTDDDIGEDGAPVTRTFCGTAEYLAPEILIGEPYTFVVDFWSLGTLVYEMLVGAVC
jgi:serine/threonine protein kinase